MYCTIVLHDSHKEAPRHNVRKRKCGVCLPQYVWSAFFVAYVLKRVFFLSFFWALPFNHVSFLLCEVFKKCFLLHSATVVVVGGGHYYIISTA